MTDSALERLQSHYKDNDELTYAHLYVNHHSNMFEVHYYDEVVKEDPPVGLFLNLPDAIVAAQEWCS